MGFAAVTGCGEDGQPLTAEHQRMIALVSDSDNDTVEAVLEAWCAADRDNRLSRRDQLMPIALSSIHSPW